MGLPSLTLRTPIPGESAAHAEFGRQGRFAQFHTAGQFPGQDHFH